MTILIRDFLCATRYTASAHALVHRAVNWRIIILSDAVSWSTDWKQHHRLLLYWYSCYCFKSLILFTDFKLFFSLIYGVDIMNADKICTKNKPNCARILNSGKEILMFPLTKLIRTVSKGFKRKKMVQTVTWLSGLLKKFAIWLVNKSVYVIHSKCKSTAHGLCWHISTHAFTDFCLHRFFWAIRFLVLFFPYFWFLGRALD